MEPPVLLLVQHALQMCCVIVQQWSSVLQLEIWASHWWLQLEPCATVKLCATVRDMGKPLVATVEPGQAIGG